ncbi:MAG: rubredoxin [Methanobrevibacter sp.]|nr:rubredoxin [Methanobrevibacter sp.]
MAFVWKVCGYFLEADELPDDYTCPMCCVDASNFEEQ